MTGVSSDLLSCAKMSVQKQDGVYPLGLATFRGRLDLVLLLLRHGATVDTRGPGGCTALRTACVRDHFTIVQKLIAAGADPNQRDEGDQGPLHWLACRGSVKVGKQSFWEADPGARRGGGGRKESCYAFFRKSWIEGCAALPVGTT